MPYKRFDLAIDACEQLEMPLVIAGSGPMEKQLRSRGGRFTKFEIAPSDERMAELMRNARAFLFPAVEDFGIIAIEALASGTPLIAFEAGGAKDFVEPDKTGVFFADQTVDSLKQAIEHKFDPSHYDPKQLAAYAHSYSKDNFLGRIRDEISTLLH